jgi:hypothetical protein
MQNKINISLNIPDTDKLHRYFSFKIQQYLNEPTEYTEQNRLFVVSGIQGRFSAFCRLLLKKGIINKYLNWIFDDGHLVIIGDCLTSGKQVIECLWFIYSLEQQARLQGGKVHFLLGHQEIANLNGDWRYIHPRYAEKSPNSKDQAVALYYGNGELWHWLQTKNIIERIGSILFMYGGASPSLNLLPYSIKEINEFARKYYTQAAANFTDSYLQAFFSGHESPPLYQGYYTGEATKKQILLTLEKFNVSTIVTGNSMVTDHVISYFNGKVINVSAGNADHIPAGLLIRKNHFYSYRIDGTRERIK